MGTKTMNIKFPKEIDIGNNTAVYFDLENEEDWIGKPFKIGNKEVGTIIDIFELNEYAVRMKIRYYEEHEYLFGKFINSLAKKE